MFLILSSVVLAQNEMKCFEKETLQGKQLVNFTMNGKEISGTFEYENGESELEKVYKFSGTLTGDVLRIKFANDELPDVAPSELRDLNWQFLKPAESEILRIKFYGKNYETNKYADYFADFELCEPSYAALAVKRRLQVRRLTK